MKKIILLTIVLFQFTVSFGQYTTTRGTELNRSVTYFKSEDGYKAPVGYEWMKPTKIYIAPYGRGTNANPLKEANYMLFMEVFFRGDNLQEANAINSIVRKIRGDRDTPIFGYELLCLDCGLGYFATVSLSDGTETHDYSYGKNIDTYPNVGFGFTCGQPTIEDAIKVAFKAAKQKLKTPAVWFTFNVGINSNAKLESTLQNILYQTYGFTYTAQSFAFQEKANGYLRLPESPDDFLAHIKSLNALCDQLGNGYRLERPNDLGYTKSWKQIGSGTKDITSKAYPIFTNKIGGSQQSSNANNGKNNSATNALLKPNEQANFEKGPSSLIQNIGEKGSKFKEYFSNAGYKYKYPVNLNDRQEDVFEHFKIQQQKDKTNFIFQKGSEKHMAPLLTQLAEVKEHVTFYVEDKVIINNGFSLTKTKGNITKGHREGVEQDYDYIMKVFKKYLNPNLVQGSSQQPVTANHVNVVNAAKAEAAKNTKENYINAAKMMEPYAGDMNGDDLNRMGFYFWKASDYSQSFKYFKQSALKGDNGGIHNLGYAYENGHGVNIDKKIAYFYYMKITPNYEEINEVYHKIGHLSEGGYSSDDNKPDYITAAKYFIKGADLGNAECMLHLGNYYNESGRIATNLKLAKQWYEKACSADVKDACEKLKKLQ